MIQFSRTCSWHILNGVILGTFLAVFTGWITVFILGQPFCSTLCGGNSLYIIWFLIPQSFIFLGLMRKSRKSAVMCYLGSALLVLTALMIWSYSAEANLMETEHFNDTNDNIKLDDSIYRNLIDRQKNFLLSSQMISAEVCGSVLLLAMLLPIAATKKKWRTLLGIASAAVLFLLLGCYFPFPIVGSWGQIGGCMTTTYNYAVFSRNNVDAYNICASIGNRGNFGHFAQYKRIAYGSYELKLDGNKDSEKTIVKSSLLQIRILSNGNWIVAGYRNLDYFTQYRFKNYCAHFLKLRAAYIAAMKKVQPKPKNFIFMFKNNNLYASAPKLNHLF